MQAGAGSAVVDHVSRRPAPAPPPADDPFFIFARMKDFWAGHSYASGIDVFADAKNQESTSEAVNGYYAVAQLGSALGDASLETYGRLMTAMEVASAQEYWQARRGWGGRLVRLAEGCWGPSPLTGLWARPPPPKPAGSFI